jgi:hypothetical protein
MKIFGDAGNALRGCPNVFYLSQSVSIILLTLLGKSKVLFPHFPGMSKNIKRNRRISNPPEVLVFIVFYAIKLFLAKLT